MPTLQDRFAKAQSDANNLAQRPDNKTMLRLYALHKQATQGDVAGELPSGFDLVRSAKFDALPSSSKKRSELRRSSVGRLPLEGSSYSYRSASTGSSLDAFRAGIIPLNTPTISSTTADPITAIAEMRR